MASTSKISVQEFADGVVAPEYRQPVKTLAAALDALGWEHVDKPCCCGREVTIRSWMGDPNFVQCKVCGKFAVDVTGPSFGNSWVSFLDAEKVNLDTDATWIAGAQPLAEMDA